MPCEWKPSRAAIIGCVLLLVLPGLGAVGTFWYFSSFHTTTLEGRANDVAAALAPLDSLSPDLIAPGMSRSLQVNAYSLSLTVELLFIPPSHETVAAVTDPICQHVVSQLLALGLDPTEEHISVYVHAQRPAGASPTGRRQVRIYGLSTYNYLTDQISFEPARP